MKVPLVLLTGVESFFSGDSKVVGGVVTGLDSDLRFGGSSDVIKTDRSVEAAVCLSY
jgi:hypothetical protein